MYTDVYQYSLTGSEGMLFKFICSAHDFDHFSSIPNSLAKLTTNRIVIEIALGLFTCFFVDMNYVFNFLKLKIAL